MIFKVGPWAYRVRITEEPLVNDQGQEVAGLRDWEASTLWIAAKIPAQKRLAVLIHELKHAWQLEFGRPSDDEGDANQSASFFVDVQRQLDRQGGESALMRLALDGTVDQTSDVEAATEPRAAQCPTCHGLLNNPIRTGQPRFEFPHSRLVVQREADCEFCGHAVSWMEAATSRGQPIGLIMGEPTIQTSSGAARVRQVV
jgi:hypothetical protein